MQKNNFKYILVAGFLVVLAVLLFIDSDNAKLVNNGEVVSIPDKINNSENKIEPSYTSRIKIKDTSVNVEIVKTSEAQARGLSGRESLLEDQGILFDFEQPGIHKFWMKDMHFAIDMIWIGEDRRVIYIKENATPESYPQSFGPEESAGYVLEVVSGFTQKYNIKIGDELVFQLPG